MALKEKVEVYELVDKDAGILLITGTLEDIRTFIKNRWKKCGDYITDILGFEVEEDYYTYLDNDTNLRKACADLNYHMEEICVVPIEDFQY